MTIWCITLEIEQENVCADYSSWCVPVYIMSFLLLHCVCLMRVGPSNVTRSSMSCSTVCAWCLLDTSHHFRTWGEKYSCLLFLVVYFLCTKCCVLCLTVRASRCDSVHIVWISLSQCVLHDMIPCALSSFLLQVACVSCAWYIWCTLNFGEESFLAGYVSFFVFLCKCRHFFSHTVCTSCTCVHCVHSRSLGGSWWCRLCSHRWPEC